MNRRLAAAIVAGLNTQSAHRPKRGQHRRLETCELCSRPIAERDLVLSRDERPAHRECADGADYREQLAREDYEERRAEERRDR